MVLSRLRAADTVLVVSTGWASAQSSRRLVAALAVSGAAMLGACTGDPAAIPGATTVGTASPATASLPTAGPDLLTSMDPLVIDATISDPSQVEAVKDLLRAQQALQRALMAPVNPDAPDFLATFTGDALERERVRIATNARDSKAYEAPSKFTIRIENLSTDAEGSVTAIACKTLGARFYRTDTGEELSNNFYSQRVQYWLLPGPDHWRVAFEGRMDEGTDQVTECPPP